MLALLLAAFGCSDDDTAAATGGSGGTGGTATSGTAGASSVGGGGTSGVGGASAGGGGTGGSVTDPCQDRLLCVDFETEALGEEPGAPWEVRAIGGPSSVVVDDARAFSGSLSVKVATDGTSGFTSAMIGVSGAPVFPLPNNVMYGRVMFYMEQAANDGVHWTHIEGRGPLSGQPGVEAMYRYGGQHEQRLMANYETSMISTDCWHHSQTTMPVGEWSCMEWQFDGPNDRMRFWIDGEEITDLDVMGSGMGCIGNDLSGQWPAPTFDEIRVGWESYQPDDPREAWIDDVIIDDAPIGCP
jgi:hypothetical protein